MSHTEVESQEISLSNTAIKRLNAILSDNNGKEHMLRVTVNGGGCSGFQYSFDLDKTQKDDDLVFERNGIRVVTDVVSFEFLAGSEIDYVDELIGSYFRVNNPNATAACSCGASFAVG